MNASQVFLEMHLRGGGFQVGEAKGRWRLLSLTWPYAYVEIRAGDGRQFTLRIDCTGYPESPPTAMLWCTSTGQMLPTALWPKGGRVSQVFNPGWKNGNALYLPCDRQSVEGHNHWFADYPWLIWNPSKGLVQYLHAVSEVLHSNELVREVA